MRNMRYCASDIRTGTYPIQPSIHALNTSLWFSKFAANFAATQIAKQCTRN